jgi:hypothetical protein
MPAGGGMIPPQMFDAVIKALGGKTYTLNGGGELKPSN